MIDSLIRKTEISLLSNSSWQSQTNWSLLDIVFVSWDELPHPIFLSKFLALCNINATAGSNYRCPEDIQLDEKLIKHEHCCFPFLSMRERGCWWSNVRSLCLFLVVAQPIIHSNEGLVQQWLIQENPFSWIHWKRDDWSLVNNSPQTSTQRTENHYIFVCYAQILWDKSESIDDSCLETVYRCLCSNYYIQHTCWSIIDQLKFRCSWWRRQQIECSNWDTVFQGWLLRKSTSLLLLLLSGSIQTNTFDNRSVMIRTA